jgi:hypothetical protein
MGDIMARKKQVAATTGNDTGKDQTAQRPSRGHLVRFPDMEARLRAVMVLGGVGIPYCGVSDDQGGILYGLMNKHLEALQQEGIPFEVVA